MIGIILITIILIYLINFYRKVKSLPPGPMPFPIIGNLFTFDFRKMHQWIIDQKKIYGNVFTIYFPGPLVVLADCDSINEALVENGDNFLGRNVNAYPDKAFHEKLNVGVVFSEGEEWRDQRRLSLHILRDFGMSRTIIQDKIHLVVQDIYDQIDSFESKDNVNIDKIIQLSVGNVINLILFGIMYSNTQDNEFFKFTKAIEEFIKGSQRWEFRILILFPFIDRIPILNKYLYKRITRSQRKMRKLAKIQVKNSRKTFNPDDEPPNFIHAVLKEIQSTDSKYSYLNSDHLEGMVLDFWIGGVETSYTTLKWFILIIMKHLDIQKKLQDEIDEVIGKDRLVQLSDKSKLPYMNAFINESQRFANIIAFAPKHKCTKDTVINGHLIPKNTIVEPFYWGANMDEKYFKDPSVFNPNRFIDDEGNLKIEHEHMSFGKGKRICAGKSLAESEIFLIFTSLVQRYKFTHPNGPVDLSVDFSGVLQPKPFTCMIESR
uniref:Cytochrome P450 18a1 (inferred by orthology to a D. melanogaster protein) n=1 Tax=Strongyloides venezuelensis TaxID=75913 RepID=A0A0K0FGA2_STRVS